MPNKPIPQELAQEAIKACDMIRYELGVPTRGYPANVANASDIAKGITNKFNALREPEDPAEVAAGNAAGALGLGENGRRVVEHEIERAYAPLLAKQRERDDAARDVSDYCTTYFASTGGSRLGGLNARLRALHPEWDE